MSKELGVGLDLDLAVANATEMPCPAGGPHQWELSTATSCGTCGRMLPLYSKSIEAAFQIEDRIAELGLQNDYTAYLWIEVGATRNGTNFWTADNFKAFWLCVHATAEQRCRAAIAAAQEENNDE